MSNIVTCSRTGQALRDWLEGSSSEPRAQLLSALAYFEPIAYQPGANVTDQRYAVIYQGDVYVPKPDTVPFVAGNPFDPNVWRRVQGASTAQLSQAVAQLEQVVEDGLDQIRATVREKLTAARNYFVRTDGNDTNNGLTNTAGGAFLTIQRAVDVVMETLDLNGEAVTINVADGTYSAGATVSGPWVGGDQVYIRGNVPNPAAVTVSSQGNAFYAEKAGTFDVRGFRVTTVDGNGVTAFSSSFISVGEMEFAAHGRAHVEIGTCGIILLGTNYTITGGGQSHLHAGSEGQIRAGDIVVEVQNNPVFSAYFAGAAQGSIILPTAEFRGAAQCVRYLAHKNATIETHPGFSPALPGNQQGRVAWGGSYVGSNNESFKVQVFPGASSAIDYQAFRGIDQAFVTKISLVTGPDGEAYGYGFFNGPGSYFSGQSSLGTSAQVTILNGEDGITTLAGGEQTHARTNGALRYSVRRGSGGVVEQFWHNGTSSGDISVDNGTTTYNTTSDERLKDFGDANYDPSWITNVGPLVKDFTFNHLDEGAHNPARKGLPAQKLAQFSPNAVRKGEGRPGAEGFVPWGVDHSQLVPQLLQELYALRQRVDELQRGG